MSTSTWLPVAPSIHRHRDVPEARALRTGLSPTYLAYGQALQERQQQAMPDAAGAGLRQPQRPAIHAMPDGFSRILPLLQVWARRHGRAPLDRPVTAALTDG
jgi:hypothetical protein